MSPELEFLRDCPEWRDEVSHSGDEATFTPEAWRAFLNWVADNGRHKGGASLESARKWVK